MPTCSFCGETLKKGSGTIYAKKDGSVSYFCSSKCRKNALNLKREGRRVKWTKSAKAFKSKS
ncbi:50S ribosomal protein L24e [Candidatus Micrarchaeota archaeon]|nr:50S ribosomal protein L24e [Candidatus Micrarchaeota archaeon]